MQEILNNTEPLKDRLLRNGFWMYLLSFIIAPAWYLIKLMISRSLSVEDVWLVYSIIGFISLLSAFNDLWLTEALQYYLPHYIIDKEYGKAKTILIITWAVQFIWWIIVWWWLYIAAPRMAEHYFHSERAIDVLRLFCVYFLFINLFQVLQSVFAALQKVKLQYATEAIRLWIVVLSVGYLFFYETVTLWNFNVLWLVWMIIWTLVSVILFTQYYIKNFASCNIEYDKKLLKVQWSYARKVMVAMQAWVIYGNIWQQFAISFLGSYQAWIWSNYMTLFTAVWIAVNPVINYLFPLFTELYKKNEETKIKLMKKYLKQWLIIWSISIAIAWYFFSEWAATFLFWEKFLFSWTLFKRSSLFFFFILWTWIQWNILAWAWYVKERLHIILIWTFFSLILSYIGAKYLGIRWLVGSLIITHIYFWWHCLRYIRKLKL